MFCPKCGKEIPEGSEFCPSCGAKADGSTPSNQTSTEVTSNKNSDINTNWLVVLLLCIFLGGLGVHRFFVGKIGTGILWLLTAGCFGIGYLVDLIMIVCGKFKDSQGNEIHY